VVQLVRGSSGSNIFPPEPDLVTGLEGRIRVLYFVGLFCLRYLRIDHFCAEFFMQVPKRCCIFRDFWYLFVLSAEVRQKTGVESVIGKKGGYLGTFGLCVIVAEFGNWQELFPVVLLVVAVCP